MVVKAHQLSLDLLPGIHDIPEGEVPDFEENNWRANKLDPQDRAFHDWYRFVLSFPPHLVRHYIDKFSLGSKSTLLDPFCGTGTTLIEAKLAGIRSVGIEANLFPHYASTVKLDWNIDPELLASRTASIAEDVLHTFSSQGIDDNQPLERFRNEGELKTLGEEAACLLLKNSISPLPLHKVLVLIEALKKHEYEPYYHHARLALANALVYKISNLHFGPEVGVRKLKGDVPVVANWMSEVVKICDDLHKIEANLYPESQVCLGDARMVDHLPKASVDAVITSPPYPNEKDYTRTTRLETVLLGFVQNKKDLRRMKKTLVRSNTRGVYKGDDDDQWITGFPDILKIAEDIEKRRIEMGKNSGFERMYSRVTKLYFGGMARHLSELRKVLRPGARLAYVVGDQASYLRIMIRTGQILAGIAESLGYEVEGIDLFRTRMATATREQLREEVLLLRWRGNEDGR
jgi:tRNA G10  N-methylase Trm11